MRVSAWFRTFRMTAHGTGGSRHSRRAGCRTRWPDAGRPAAAAPCRPRSRRPRRRGMLRGVVPHAEAVTRTLRRVFGFDRALHRRERTGVIPPSLSGPIDSCDRFCACTACRSLQNPGAYAVLCAEHVLRVNRAILRWFNGLRFVRRSRSQCGGREFDPRRVHHQRPYVRAVDGDVRSLRR